MSLPNFYMCATCERPLTLLETFVHAGVTGHMLSSKVHCEFGADRGYRLHLEHWRQTGKFMLEPHA